MTLSDNLILLSAPEPADLDRLYIWENDPELWPCGDTSAPLSRHQLEEYIAGYDADIFSARQLRMVIRLAATGEAVGTLDITDFNPRDRHAHVGIFVAPAFRRQGIGLRALSLLRPYAADTLGIHTLLALTAADNEPSRALFSAGGYTTCGRIRSYLRRGRSYCDIIIYQTLL